jgi:pantoate--beta-alanine ligase
MRRESPRIEEIESVQMEVLPDKTTLRDWIGSRRDRPRVLVPTMGALHRGHTSLFDRAREEAVRLEGDVIATIFVNPTQFGPNEDFSAYPRPLEADLAKCREHGVDAVLVPEAGEMYAGDRSITITENRLSTTLCGASRPGHFDGVCTVVAKLFLLTQPDVAIFGEKDFQQLAVIRRLVRDLDFRIEIIGAPTVREEDGLALSSRNVYLTPEQRAQAPVLQRALASTALGIAEGRLATPGAAREAFLGEFAAASLARLDYFEIVDSSTLERLDEFGGSVPRLLAAAFFGKTRLIDNVGIPGQSRVGIPL